MSFNNAQEIILKLKGVSIEQVSQTSFLSMEIEQNLHWKAHFSKLSNKLDKGIFILSQLVQSLNLKQCKKVYFAHFYSFLSYGMGVWGDERINKQLTTKLFKKQKKAIRLLANKNLRRTSCRGLFKKLDLLTLPSLYILQLALLARKNCKEKTNENVHQHDTRNKKMLHVQKGCAKSIQNRTKEVVGRTGVLSTL